MARRGSAEVAAELRRAIEGGAYRRFERLPPSRTLAEQFGVARNTLRDALYLLGREGLLETRPGSGTYITVESLAPAPTVILDATPLELIDARFALEPHICRLCVLHARREDFDAMDALCGRMEAAVHDPHDFGEADTEFHRTLAGATRNNLLIWLIDQINKVRSLDEWNRMRHLTLDPEIIRVYNTQHRAVVDAIRERDAERAATAMKEQLETARLSLTRAAET